MRIAGLWHQCDAGVVRPVLVIDVRNAVGITVEEAFLVDSGADGTVFRADLLSQLGGATAPSPSGVTMSGIGGAQGFVQVQATLNLRRA